MLGSLRLPLWVPRHVRMTRPTRLLLLLVPLAIGLAAARDPGAAQTAPPAPTGRFAFADTTLLRDTLNLTFGRLFPLADSLGLTPDTLRALSIRYRMSLDRITFLSDSLHATVDSVGVIMRREQFNPLSSKLQRATSLQYTSSYNIAQTTNIWTNAADWNLVRGPLFLRNSTNISLQQFRAGGQLNLQQNRTATTEGGWKFSPNASLGGRANLERFDSKNPGNLNNESEIKNEFQLSARAKGQPSRNLGGELSFFGGILGLTNVSQIKRGVSGDLTGHTRYQRDWLVNDVTGHLSGNAAKTRVPGAIQEFDTRDLANSIDGTLGMYQNSPIGLNVTYGIRRVRVESPLDSTQIQQIRTNTDKIVTAVRMRRDNDRYLNVTERLGRSGNATASNLSSLNTRSDQAFDVDGRYALLGWYLDGSFDNTYYNSRFPKRVASGGYLEKTSSRQVQSSLTHAFGPRFTFTANGNVSLSQSRYSVIDSFPSLPVDRDQYRQQFRIDGQYNRSQRISTGAAMEVIRLSLISLPSQSTGGNNETRTYRAEWRWTCQILPGFTATQRNQLSADYIRFPNLPVNNRLTLNYEARTTLNAVVTPRTSIEITHVAQTSPSGNYTLLSDAEYFSKADESRNYTLRTRITFQPTPLFALNVTTEYLANTRATVTDQGSIPQRDDRTLNFSGGGNLNIPLGAKGRLSGDLQRSYRGNRGITFQNGLAQPSPRAESDYWNGRLELSWQL